MLVTTAGAFLSDLSLFATPFKRSVLQRSISLQLTCMTVLKSTITSVLTSSPVVWKMSFLNKQSKQSPKAVVAAGARVAPGLDKTPSILVERTGRIT